MSITQDTDETTFDTPQASAVVEALLRQHKFFLRTILEGVVVPASDFGEKLGEINTRHDQLNERIKALTAKYPIPEHTYSTQLKALNDLYKILTGADASSILESPLRHTSRTGLQLTLQLANIADFTGKDQGLIDKYFPKKTGAPVIRLLSTRPNKDFWRDMLKKLVPPQPSQSPLLHREHPYDGVFLQTEEDIYGPKEIRPFTGLTYKITSDEILKESIKPIAADVQRGAILHHELLLYDALTSDRVIEPYHYSDERSAILRRRDSLHAILEETQKFCGPLDENLQERLAFINWIYEELTYPDYHTVLEKSGDPRRPQLLQGAFGAEPEGEPTRPAGKLADTEYKEKLVSFQALAKQLATRQSYGKE